MFKIRMQIEVGCQFSVTFIACKLMVEGYNKYIIINKMLMSIKRNSMIKPI